MIDFHQIRLVSRMRSGRPEAFTELYDRYASRLKGYALSLTGNNADADDLVQETLMAAWQGRETFLGRASLLSWLLGVASRIWRDRCRRRHVATISLSEQDGERDIPISDTPEKCLEMQVIQHITLEAALATLDLPFREALLLVHSQGLTYREASEVLGEPIGTVKWRVSEGLTKVKRQLAKYEEEFDELHQTSVSAAV
jgi:RNA polymerase sigma-70 factor (ECF subfamily)